MPSGERKKKRRGTYALSKHPYTYSYRNCEHKSHVYQQVILWRGLVCASCNNIVRRFER
jgi:hypothetical protein